MGGEGESVAGGREAYRVDPSSGVVQVLAADGIEGQTLAPDRCLRSLIDAFDKAGEDAGMGVGRACS